MPKNIKKGSQSNKVKPRRAAVKAPVSKKAQTIAEVRRELAESLERENATNDILRMIATSTGDLQHLLDTIAERAARLCNSIDAQILSLDDEGHRAVASYGPISVTPRQERVPLDRGSVAGRSMLDRQTIHVHDILNTPVSEYPRAREFAQRHGNRTVLSTPLLRRGVPIGAILIRRIEARPFTERQIKLLETFADQAVIAIENARLLQELTVKSTELESSNSELREALEQQTATSEILGVIASSPTDIQPVLDALARSAAQLCESYDAVIHRVDGDEMQRVAHFGPVPVAEDRRPISRHIPMGRAIINVQTIHVHDVLAEIDNEFPDARGLQQQTGTRTVLAMPLIREGVAIGVINVRRIEVRPFTEKEIALLKTFADQAVIAIENVRLFKELDARNRDLTEALEQQTATGEVLRVIASSPTELQPVLDTLLANAVKLSGAKQGHIRRSDGEFLRVVAHYNETPDRIAVLESNPLPLNSNIAAAQAFLQRKAIHLLDTQVEAQGFHLLARHTGVRTLLTVPLLREGAGIGTITIWRDFVEPFSERQIELVKSFADQAVIAIENVRLFKELTEALEQQTATSEILGVIASSPTDLKPVLETITERATRVCGAEDGVLRLVEGNVLRLAAHCGSIPDVAVERPINRDSPPGRAVVDQVIIHHEDVDQLIESEYPEVRETRQRLVARTFLAVPLVREGVALGVIHFRRLEVRPFSDKQIALIKTFADQAVIAIENVRLFQQLQERNKDLREALEHQTATAEVLGIISRSPTDVQPVLDAIVESAARVCGIDDVVLRLQEGNAMVCRAHFGPLVINRGEISIHEPQFDWMREHGTLHIPDAQRPDRFTDGGYRRLADLPDRSPSSAKRPDWRIVRTPHRGAPLFPCADQTS